MADTIQTKDGKEIRGIVVEDYKDRLVFSTPDGEVSVMKSDIKELSYDNEDDNLIKLGELAVERGDYMRAFAYYEKAYKVNPNSKSAKDGLVYLQGYLLRKDEAKKEEAIRRQTEFESMGGGGRPVPSTRSQLQEAVDTLRNTAGLTLAFKGNFPEVKTVKTDFAAYAAGLRKGDLLVAIWGRLTGYMSLEEVLQRIIEKTSLEVRCTIERICAVSVTPGWNRLANRIASTDELIGATFSMEFDGLTVASVREGGVAELAGMQKGDLIVEINGKSTRYMPLEKAIKNIRRSRGREVKLTIRREITFWRT